VGRGVAYSVRLKKLGSPKVRTEINKRNSLEPILEVWIITRERPATEGMAKV